MDRWPWLRLTTGATLRRTDAQNLETLNRRINAALQESGDREALDSGEALELLKEAEKVSRSILWGA